MPKNAVFLLISDEDDVSQPKDCLLSYESELKNSRVEQSASACSSGCDTYRYTMQMTRRWQRLPFTCAAFTDTGTRIAGTDKSSWYNLGACDAMNPGTCTAAERATVQGFCDSGLTLAECTRECASQESTCRVDLPDGRVNACTESFSYNGKTWDNLATYCGVQGSAMGACSGGGVKLQYTESRSGTYSQVNLTPGTTNTADIGNYFKTTAAKAFASGGYLLEGILFDPSFSCTLGSGQSYATNLAGFIADKSHLFPLCESYAPALDGVLGFAQTLIQTEFKLELEDDEHVSDVIIVGKDNAERKLPVAAFQFDAATGTLTVDPASIRATDINLRVEITSECRPILR